MMRLAERKISLQLSLSLSQLISRVGPRGEPCGAGTQRPPWGPASHELPRPRLSPVPAARPGAVQPQQGPGSDRGAAAAGACWGCTPLTVLLLSRLGGPILPLTSPVSALPGTPAAIRAPAPGKPRAEVLRLVQ